MTYANQKNITSINEDLRMKMLSVRLGDIISYNKGFAFSSNEYTDNGVMVVQVTNFTQDSVSTYNIQHIQENEKYSKYLLNTGDILIQTVGSWENNPKSIVGKVVRVPKACNNSYLNQNIVRIIPNGEVDKNYLYYSMIANNFSMYCVRRGQGAANQASITLETIFRFKFNICWGCT